MKVLVACEESQRVALAFRNKGHQAFSCDLQDCSGGAPDWHIKGDVIPVIEHNSWDLIIAHPPCTYLSAAGAVNLRRNGIICDSQRYEKMLAAKDFFMYFYNLTGVRVCIENPRPMSICGLPEYSQIIQPYQFGDNYSKQTFLWLKGLPYLFPNCVGIDKRSAGFDSWCAVHRSPKLRSKTFSGIANAMATQWGDL